VAPPRKQAANRENKHVPAAMEGSCLLEKLGEAKRVVTRDNGLLTTDNGQKRLIGWVEAKGERLKEKGQIQ
jgi:hypothetical protein